MGRFSNGEAIVELSSIEKVEQQEWTNSPTVYKCFQVITT